MRVPLIAIGIAAVSTIAVSTTSSPVRAACAGTSNPYASGSGWGYETAQNLTCDNLGDYNGIYRDTLVDGKRVRIRTKWINGSGSWSYTGLTNGLNVNYYYGYWDNNKSTQFQICRNDGACASQGNNWGF